MRTTIYNENWLFSSPSGTHLGPNPDENSTVTTKSGYIYILFYSLFVFCRHNARASDVPFGKTLVRAIIIIYTRNNVVIRLCTNFFRLDISGGKKKKYEKQKKRLRGGGYPKEGELPTTLQTIIIIGYRLG